MFCNKCGKNVGDCSCEDMDARLEELSKNGYLIYRKCLLCGKHYARCKCSEPVWGTSRDKNLVEKN